MMDQRVFYKARQIGAQIVEPHTSRQRWSDHRVLLVKNIAILTGGLELDRCASTFQKSSNSNLTLKWLTFMIRSVPKIAAGNLGEFLNNF